MGAQFTNSVWTGVCTFLGISVSTTTSYQSNGFIEQFHRSLKTALHSRLASSDWVQHLPLVLLGLCSLPKDDTDLSVSKALFEAPLTVSGEFLESPELPPATYLSKVECAVAGFAVSSPHHVLQFPLQPLPAALMSAKYVFVHKLAPLYRGPYLVLERQDKFLHLQLGSGRMLSLWTSLNPFSPH